jgi:hypothetical protein
MATTTYLSSPNLTINSVVLQDQCHGLTFTRTIEALEKTSFGTGSTGVHGRFGKLDVVV